MAVGQMRQTMFEDYRISQFQDAANQQFSQISKIPFINGNLISDQALTASTANTIDTKLGKKAVGYFVISNTANTPIWNDSISSDTSIVLRCSADTTVSIWVF